MNKQELLTQADYTFQRGNRELAEKYLLELLTEFPKEEAAWMLLARVVEEKERKIECYECVLKLNPENREAKLALTRVRATLNPTLPRQHTAPWQPKKNPYRNLLRGSLIVVILFLLFGTTTYVIALNNPNSPVAKVLSISTPDLYNNLPLAGDVAPKTRADVSKKYPQYATLVNALLSFAVQNAKDGMDGAPERPGDEIVVSDQSGREAKQILENSLPQPGALTSVTITEQQMTSWLAMAMKSNPDLPFSGVQVYLRDGKVQIWGIVNGSDTTTSALIVGEVTIDSNKQPYFKIESMQIGKQVIPTLLVSQMESWINQVMAETINEQIPGLELMNVKVTNGLITVSGMR